MVIAYLSVGSNLGNRVLNIKNTVNALSETTDITVSKVSSLYKTSHVGKEKDQPDYLNCVIEIQTKLSPKQLLVELQDIEHRLGRVRSYKNAPRPVDIDILLYNNMVLNSADLVIPHPEMHKRKFVLEPLVEINSNLIHPTSKKYITDLLKNLAHDKKQKIELYKTNKGFTLIELMVVIVILGILAAVITPRIPSFIRKAKESKTKGNLAIIRNTMNLYYGDVGGIYPTGTDLAQVNACIIPKYIQVLPIADMTPSHAPSSIARLGSDGDINDDGGWWYQNKESDNEWGEVKINCNSHTDIDNVLWSSY